MGSMGTMSQTNASKPARAIVRFTNTHCLVLCPIGHLVTARKLDWSWAGSQFETDIAAIQHNGGETAFDRLARSCDGAGHALDPVRDQLAAEGK